MKLPNIRNWTSVIDDNGKVEWFIFDLNVLSSELDCGDLDFSTICIERSCDNSWFINPRNVNLQNTEDKEVWKNIIRNDYKTPLKAYIALKDIEFICLERI